MTRKRKQKKSGPALSTRTFHVQQPDAGGDIPPQPKMLVGETPSQSPDVPKLVELLRCEIDGRAELVRSGELVGLKIG